MTSDRARFEGLFAAHYAALMRYAASRAPTRSCRQVVQTLSFMAIGAPPPASLRRA